MNLTVWLSAVALLIFVAGLWWWQQRGRGQPAGNVLPIPPGQTTTVQPQCGSKQIIGPFPGHVGGGTAQVLIKVLAACGREEAEIETEGRRANTWDAVNERVVSPALGPRNEKPKVGSWYVVSVPRNRHIRLTCPGGDGRCAFEVTDISNQANLAFDITGGNANPSCGALTASRLINLSDKPVRATVSFSSLCTDNNGNAQPGRVHFVQVRPSLPGAAPLPPPPDISVAPASPTWSGGLDPGFTLEAGCTGNRGTCNISVRMSA